MTTVTTTNEPVVIPANVAARLREAFRYIERMEYERQGCGPNPAQEVNDTRQSLMRALDTMLDSRVVWNDGADGLCFGGIIGGIQYGLIARPKPSSFDTKPLEWSFHS